MRSVDAGRGTHRAWSAAMLLFCIFVAGCARPEPEQALREALEGLLGAIEARDARGASDFLTPDFIGPGGMDRDEARRIAALSFIRHGDVGVLPGPLDIELHDMRARVRFGAVVSGGAGDRLLPEEARAWQVDTGWRLVDGEWRLASADWTPALR